LSNPFPTTFLTYPRKRRDERLLLFHRIAPYFQESCSLSLAQVFSHQFACKG
jgi:hypothetical protein